MKQELDSLLQMPKEKALSLLEDLSLQEKWDCLLQGQCELLFDAESKWLSEQDWWTSASSVQEMGCGNGSFLGGLVKAFPEKQYQATDRDSGYISQARELGIDCSFEDVEEVKSEQSPCFDVVILRLVLQHLSSPEKAIENAYQRLRPGGTLLIIDAYDPVSKTSHPSPLMERAKASLKLAMGAMNKDRSASLTLLQSLQSNRDSGFKVLSSNLDADGKLVGFLPYMQGVEKSTLCFRNMLIFLSILQRQYRVEDVDLGDIWDELAVHFDNEDYGFSIGMHLLVLRKPD